MSHFTLKRAALLACCLSVVSAPAMAQNITGPSQIGPVTSTIPDGTDPYPLSQIADGIFTNGPHNGFQGADYTAVPATQNPVPVPSSANVISFTLNQPYDITQFHLWNDINVRKESVSSFQLRFYDASGLIATSAVFNTVAGTVAQQDFSFPMVSGVTRVEMIVLGVFNIPPAGSRPGTFARRVEIREVAFTGERTPPPEVAVPMPGNHWQCYRVVQGPTLKPEELTIQDQFGRAQIVLGKPVLLCNPSTKVHNRVGYDIKEPDIHLVCYQPVKQSDRQIKRKVKINNQMAPATLDLAGRQMFCVPSSKKRLDRPDKPVAVPMDEAE